MVDEKAFVGRQKPKRERKGVPKSKTGCRTCRIRHVKCDEAKPACSRCTSTGRSCDFADPQKGSPSPPSTKTVTKRQTPLFGVAEKYRLLPRPACPPSISFSPHEGNQLDFFRLICTRPFSGYFDNPLWDKTVLQIASTEPSIRSALVAFATLIRLHAAQGPESSAVAIEKVNFDYQRAVGALNQRLDGSGASLELALVGSLLFTAFETNQGRDRMANVHFDGGFAVLQEYEAISSHDSDSFKEISNVFSQFDTQASTYAVFYPSKSSGTPVVPTVFRTVEEARRTWENIVRYMHRLLKRYEGYYSTLPYTPVPSVLAVRHANVKRVIEAFDTTLKISASVFEKNSAAIHVLKAQHLTATLHLSTFFYLDELAYDAFNAQFRKIISHCQSVIEISMMERTDRAGLGFSFDLGIIWPLYTVACKCRHPVLRRRAIGLLPRSNVEGLWDGKAMAAIAQWVMNREEGGSIEGETDDHFIPEECRLRKIAHLTDKNTKTALPVSCTRSHDGRLHYVGATVHWGEKADMASKRQNPATGIEGSLDFWINSWRSYIEEVPPLPDN